MHKSTMLLAFLKKFHPKVLYERYLQGPLGNKMQKWGNSNTDTLDNPIDLAKQADNRTGTWSYGQRPRSDAMKGPMFIQINRNMQVIVVIS